MPFMCLIKIRFWFLACIASLYNFHFFFQTLDIVAENPDKFRVVGLAAGSNVTLLADQVLTET